MSANSVKTDPLRCVAVSLKPAIDGTDPGTDGPRRPYGPLGRTEREIFHDFVEENRTCHWNPHLRESVEGVRFAGFLCDPPCLLVTGRDIYLDTLLTAWSTRVLRSPQGFTIHSAGEVSGLQINFMSQTPYTPLTDVLCMIISDCNRVRVCATFDVILAQLNEYFSTVQQPSEAIVYGTLDQLLKDRKIYHSGTSYYIITPETLNINGCILVRDDHIILGNTGGRVNGMPAICIPLQGVPKKTSPCHKSTSCQTEAPVDSQTSDHESTLQAQASEKVAREPLSRGSSMRKSKLGVNDIVPTQSHIHSGKMNISKNSPDVSSLKNSEACRRFFQQLLCRNERDNRPAEVGNSKDPRPSIPSVGAAALKSNHQKSQLPLHLKTEGHKELIYDDDASANLSKESSIFGQSCLGFSAKRKASKEVDDVQPPLTGKSELQRSRSMSPDSRSSSAALESPDEIPLPKEERARSKSKTWDNRRLSLSSKSLSVAGKMSRSRSQDSLRNFHSCECRSDSFELQPAEPHEGIKKARRATHRRGLDSHDYVSRAFRKYRRLKGLSLQRESHCIASHQPRTIYRAPRSLSQDSGLNALARVRGQTTSEAVSQFPYDLKTIHLRNGATVSKNRPHDIIHSVENQQFGMEDSGFMSCRALPNYSDASFTNPTYVPMHPGVHRKNSMRSNSMQKAAFSTINSFMESGRNFSSTATADSKYCDRSLSFLSRDTLTLDSKRADTNKPAGESHAIAKDSWSNSSRNTVIDNGRKVSSSAVTEASRQDGGGLPPEPFPSLLPGLSLNVEQKCGDHFQEPHRADPPACDRKNRGRRHPIKIPFRKTNSALNSGIPQ